MVEEEHSFSKSSERILERSSVTSEVKAQDHETRFPGVKVDFLEARHKRPLGLEDELMGIRWPQLADSYANGTK